MNTVLASKLLKSLTHSTLTGSVVSLQDVDLTREFWGNIEEVNIRCILWDEEGEGG